MKKGRSIKRLSSSQEIVMALADILVVKILRFVWHQVCFGDNSDMTYLWIGFKK
jgi:hypothetical protein